MLIKKTSFAVIPAYYLLFLMLFVPTKYQIQKASLILVVVFIIFAKIIVDKGKISLHPSVLLCNFLITILGMAYIFFGELNGNPGAIRVATVYVIWPWLYTLFVIGMASEKIIDGIIRVMIFSSIAVAVYAMSYIMYASGIIPEFLYIPLDLGQNIGFYDGTVEVTLLSISSLVYLIPFILSAIMVWTEVENFVVRRSVLWISFVIGSLVVVLSGRRALLIVVALAPLFTYVFRMFLPNAMKVKTRSTLLKAILGMSIVIIIGFSILSYQYGIRLDSFLLAVQQGFEFDNDPAANLRKIQFEDLMDGFYKHPFFGVGLGAQGGEVIRDQNTPWAYELQYVYLLYCLGIIGFSIYLFGVLWIYWSGIRVIKEGGKMGLYIIPALVAMTCFLIANATNPYLVKYDYIFVLFIPISIINYSLLKKKEVVQ